MSLTENVSRRKTKIVNIGSIKIGGENIIAVQSMTNRKTEDVEATIAQIKELEDAGCEIVRIAIPNKNAIKAIESIKNKISIPLIADIHFKWEYAIAAIEAGADKIRINPGNIGNSENIASIVDKAKEYGIAMRIGVNSGSLHRKYRDEGDPATALVKSCMEYVGFCEDIGYYNLVLSVKSSSVVNSIRAYKMLAGKTDYPLHLGITESGSATTGTVKSSVGLGILLADGIGDTMRVSLSADPVREVQVAYHILQSLDIRKRNAEIVSCPTCGRCNIDLIPVVEEIETRLAKIKAPHDLKVAIMGCAVNGPGEAKDAHIGIAGGRNEGIIFRKGEAIRKVSDNEMAEELMQEIERLIKDVKGAEIK